MIALLRAELLRIRSRRLTWVALGLVVLIVLAVQIAVYTSVRPLTAAEQSRAQASYQEALRDYEQNKEQYEQNAQECVDQGNPREVCDYKPTLENYAQRSVSTFADVADLAVTVSVLMTALALLILSASLVGADFSSGALSNWLSFLPERTKVFLTKLAAPVLVGAAATAVLAFAALGLTALVTTLAGADVVGLGHAAAQAGRGTMLGVVAVLVGFGIAMLTRHTIAAVGAVLAYLFLTFVYNILVYRVPAIQGLQRVLPENHALSLLNHGHTYTTYVNQVTADGTYQQEAVEHTISFAASGLYWVVVLGVLVGVAYVVFRRRDVN